MERNDTSNTSNLIQRVEELQILNNTQQEEIQSKNNAIIRLEKRVQSLLDEKENMETLMQQIEEAHSSRQIEEQQYLKEEALREEISSEKHQLELKITELEHQKNKAEDSLLQEKTLKEELFKKISKVSEEFEQFKQVSVSKLKYQEATDELTELRDKVNSLESTATFREMKVKELETKNEEMDKRFIRQRNQSKVKLEERIEETQKRLQTKILKLKENVTSLETENKRLRSLQGDPEYVSKIESELQDYKLKEIEQTERLEKITTNFEAIESQINKEKDLLLKQLEQKKVQINSLEQELFESKRHNKILMSETQTISRRSISRIGNSAQMEAKKYIDQFLKVNAENQNLKVQNALLAEEIVYLQKRHLNEMGVLYSVLIDQIN